MLKTRKLILISQTFTSSSGHDGRGNALAFARTFKQHTKEEFPIYVLTDSIRKSYIVVRDFIPAADSQIGSQWVRCIEDEDGLTAV